VENPLERKLRRRQRARVALRQRLGTVVVHPLLAGEETEVARLTRERDDVNVLVEESLNLAYHGARAEKQDFKISLEKFLDPAAGEADVYPQEITRALLNLISNGFYAAAKRKEQDNSEGYEPTLTAKTKNLGDRVEVAIRDNGTGIQPDVKEKMFNPFFTTKPPGEDTGLGLSIWGDRKKRNGFGRWLALTCGRTCSRSPENPHTYISDDPS
jgi:signal transduction histidine kinase